MIQRVLPQAKVQFLPGGRGDFIVKADGRELWNKRQMGDEFPEDPSLVDAMKGLT